MACMGHLLFFCILAILAFFYSFSLEGFRKSPKFADDIRQEDNWLMANNDILICFSRLVFK